MVGGDDKVVREGGKEEEEEKGKDDDNSSSLDVPSAQGHTLIHGPTAEQLAELYGLELVDPSYFFTQNRWDEHVRALQREREEGRKKGGREGGASWSADEYLPQGTCGAVALDREGVVCVATSTGGITNKLTGRIGDTPTVGAGFWAEEWEEEEEGKSSLLSLPAVDPWQRMVRVMSAMPGPAVHVSSTLRSFLADCMPSPFLYAPVTSSSVQTPYHPTSSPQKLYTTRSVAFSGTGNGDSFLRVAAVRTVAGIARWAGVSARQALRQVAGPGGELERSAGARWGRTGEGEGGMIGIEVVVSRDGAGNMVETRAEVLDDRNCAGMFRAYVDDDGKTVVKLWDADETLS
ncbi:nucleophile aminohydrolase [Xylariomycetidae sp. FL2044]|nr:nucleophile aminohydrolase [Xylariomycetidae sp. FL2044]